MRRARDALLIVCLMLSGAANSAVEWRIQPKDSTLTFVATQAGAKFEGAFEKFVANIRFDPQDLAASRFDVTVDVASVNSRDAERDEVIRGSDLLAAQQWAVARYAADKFIAKGADRFSAVGKLTLRNVTRDVPIEFTFQRSGNGAQLRGSAKLNRLEFGVGQGDWKTTEWVGAEVEVRFALSLTQ